jgi:hypothetical protein
MAYLIDEKRFINDSVFKFEQRMESQYTRFLDKTPTFVTYYNISVNTSTTDSGLFNIEKVLGGTSPLKFNKIEDLPVYGIDGILLGLSEEDEGLTTNFEADGTILPNTVKPYPNDLFTVTYLDKNYLFMVTAIDYDYIKSNNFYKINFMLRSVTEDQIAYLEKQTEQNFTCIFRNIGTTDKCIIETEDYFRIMDLNTVYKKISERYQHTFYSKKYNSFVYHTYNHTMVYDAFLNYFIDSNGVFNEKFNHKTLKLSNEDYYESFEFDYDLSIYNAIENKDTEQMPDSLIYTLKPITYQNSVFHYYRASASAVMFVPLVENYDYMPPELFTRIKQGFKDIGDSVLRDIMVDYFNDRITSMKSFNVKELKHLSKYFKADFETYILVPIILFIIRSYYFGFIQNTQNK